MAGTAHDDVPEEKFARNGGTAIAVLGAIVIVAFLVGWAAAALLGGALIWTSTIRPRVLVQGTELVLRNMVDTIRIPLAAIDEVAVRQVMAVRAGDRRYVCAGAGRSMRQALRGSPSQKARQEAGAFTGEMAVAMEPGILYADFVENRVNELIRKDRHRLGIGAYTEEAAELAKQVRREWAWPEIAALAGTSLFLLVAIVVG